MRYTWRYLHDEIRKSHWGQEIDVTSRDPSGLARCTGPMCQPLPGNNRLPFVRLVLGLRIRGSGGAGRGGSGVGLRTGCGAARPCMLREACFSFFSLYCSQPSSPPPLVRRALNTLACAAPVQLTAWCPETWTLGWATQGKTPVLQKMKRRGRGRNRRTGQELGLVHASPYHGHQNFSFK